MKVSDLESINKTQTRALKVCKVLLWHLRLNQASQSYLELAKTRLPYLSGITITEEIKGSLDCKLGKAKHQPFLSERV